jgi:hypothetical protein
MCLQFIIDPDELTRLQSAPFNPPAFDNQFSEADFDQEYWHAHTGLRNVLIGLGFSDSTSANSRPDFSMNDDFSLSRFIGVEIYNHGLATRNTLHHIARFLCSLSQDYIVFLTCDFDDSTELFFVVVIRDKAIGQFEGADSAEAFGFDPTSEFIKPIE